MRRWFNYRNKNSSNYSFVIEIEAPRTPSLKDWFTEYQLPVAIK